VLRAPAGDRFVPAIDALEVGVPEALVAALDGDQAVADPAQRSCEPWPAPRQRAMAQVGVCGSRNEMPRFLLERPRGGSGSERQATTLHPAPWPRVPQMVLDEMTVEQHVAVDHQHVTCLEEGHRQVTRAA